MFGKLAAGLALSCSLAFGAQAATLYVYAEATPGAGTGSFERGVADRTVLNTVTTDNVNVTLTSSYFSYFDNGAGLGVCKVLDGNSQCNPANDDNVTAGEWVDIAFDTAQPLSNIVFRAFDSLWSGDAGPVASPQKGFLNAEFFVAVKGAAHG